MATNGGAQVSWSDVFVEVANDNKYWDREVHRPAMLDLARGKRGDEPTAADEEDPTGLTTCSRRCAPVWSRSRSPASNQGAARLLPSLAVQFAIFFFVELFAGAASRSAAGAGVGCRGTRRACGRRVASFRGGLVAGRLLALLLVGSMGGIAGVIPWKGLRRDPPGCCARGVRGPERQSSEEADEAASTLAFRHEAGCAGVDVDAQVAARPIARRLRKAAAPADPHFHRARRGRRWLTHGAEVRREPVGASVASSSGTASSSRSGRTRARSSTGVRFELRLT